MGWKLLFSASILCNQGRYDARDVCKYFNVANDSLVCSCRLIQQGYSQVGGTGTGRERRIIWTVQGLHRELRALVTLSSSFEAAQRVGEDYVPEGLRDRGGRCDITGGIRMTAFDNSPTILLVQLSALDDNSMTSILQEFNAVVQPLPGRLHSTSLYGPRSFIEPLHMALREAFSTHCCPQSCVRR